MVFSSWLWSRTKSMMTKNTRQMLAISKAMHIRWCDAGRIAWWSASVASCKATRCRHRASACAVSPRRPPWSTILKRKKNTTKTQLLSSFLTVDQHKKVSISKTQGPSTHILGVTSSPNCNHYATSQPEQYRFFLTIKRSKQTKIRKVIKLEQSPWKPVAHMRQ